MFRLVLGNLYETCSSSRVLISKSLIDICLSVCIRHGTECTSVFCTTCCFHIQSTWIKMAVSRDMTPYALVHTYQDFGETDYFSLHCALRDQGYSWKWFRVINWWTGVSVSKEYFVSIFRIPPWVTRIWFLSMPSFGDKVKPSVPCRSFAAC
jgi:hypothetical protein